MSYDDNSDLPGPSRGYGQRRERVVSSINVAPSNFVRKQMIKAFMADLNFHEKQDFLVDLLKRTDRTTILSITQRAVQELEEEAKPKEEEDNDNSSKECFINRLPEPVFISIFGQLDPSDLFRCLRVCRQWHRICQEQSLWKTLCHDPERYRLGSEQAELDQISRLTEKNGTFKWKKVFEERLRLWRNWHSGRCVVREFLGHTEGVSCVQFDKDRIISSGYDNTIHLWDRRSNCGGLGQMTLNGHVAAVRSLHLQNGRLASGSADKSVRVWDMAMTANWSHVACKQTLIGHTNTVRCLQMQDETLISGSYDNTLKIWNIDRGHCLRTLHGHNESVLCLQYNQEYSKICSGSGDRSIRIWDPRQAHPSAMINNSHADAVTTLRFDGNRLVSGSVDSTIKVWDIRSLNCLYTIDWQHSEGHTRVVRAVQLDNMRMISASDDRTIKMWRVSDGKRICTLQGHADGVTSVQFDEKCIISASFDRTVRLWDFSIC